ncbi:hypothetical protein NECAME_10403 [Necator americanus]|uniref:Uncharacterized protein n=1 Tax=Necator americanus TaxID=51031 RepID=W2T9S9_NECAM|nr:hypothetical protein NECAME_10403 [Necator americanus]ETN78339.1 hypothetical protein NECAME_10403 [Necator americanus]
MVEGIVATDNDALQKEKEAQELARTIELEQQKIQQLKEERERIAKQKKEQIERLKKEQAIEQARIEAARAQRKRMEMLEEQRRKLAEAKKERERQEKIFGSQALTNNSQNDIWRKYTAANGVEPKEERDTAPSIASSVDDSNQENSVDPAYFEDTERYNPPVESSTYLAVSDLPKCIIKTAAINFLKIKKKRKNKKRKSRRKAHGTKTLSSTKWKHGKELTYDKVK